MSAYRPRVLSTEQIERFHGDGYLVIPGVFSPERMDRALEASDLITYGMPFAAWQEQVVKAGAGRAVADGISRHDNPGRAQFPTGSPALDGLIEQETFLDIISDIAGSDDLHYVNGHLFVRAGPTDARHAPHPWEGFHFDHETSSFLPPWNEPGRFDYFGAGVLLHDVDDDCAPVVQVPGSHRMVPAIIPRLKDEGIFLPPNGFTDARLIPEFSKRTTWTGRKGTVGISSSYMVHAAAPFKDRSRQRAWWTLSVGRSADSAFNRFASPYATDRRHIIPFWTKTTARVRSLFGWPPPGHPYYTPETIALLADQYPGMDLSAYAPGPAISTPAARIMTGYESAPGGGMQRRTTKTSA